MTPEERAQDARDELLLEAYWLTFRTPSGEAVLENLRFAFFDQVGFQEGISTPHDAVFHAGERHVIAHILQLLSDYERWKG